MNCVLFAKMDQVFSLKKIKTLKQNWKMEKITGKVREFCQSGKVGTMFTWHGHDISHYNFSSLTSRKSPTRWEELNMLNIHHHCSNSLVLLEPAVLTTRLQYAQIFNTMHFINFMEFAVFKNFEVLIFFLNFNANSIREVCNIQEF